MADLRPWERIRDERQAAAKKLLDGPDNAKCPKCECEFFEVIKVQQVRMENVSLGCELQPAGPSAIYLAKCLQCGEICAPLMDTLGRPKKEQDMYNACLDIVDKKNKENKNQ